MKAFANGNRKEYTYSKRNLLHETRYYEDGSLVKKTIYGYDDQERKSATKWTIPEVSMTRVRDFTI